MKEKIWAISVVYMLLAVPLVAITPTTAEEPFPAWTEDIRLTEVDWNYSSAPRIAADSMNNLHVVWNEARHGPTEIYYMKVNDQGNIVVGETVVSTLDSATSTLGDIEVDSNDDVHIVWSGIETSSPFPNIELYYKKLDNDGNTLVEETRITNAPYYSLYASMAIDSDDNLHIAWSEEIDVMGVLQEEIYYTKLDNNGNTLVEDQGLTPNDSEESLFPDIQVDSQGNAHIVWLDDRNETGGTKCQDIYYTKLNNNGDTVVDDTKLFVRGQHYRPSLAVDSYDMLHLACGGLINKAGNEHYQIYYVKLDNNGDPVTGEQRLTNDEENATHPVMDIDGEDNLHIVWEDERHGNSEIYYMKLDDMGSILVNEQRLTANDSISERPDIVLDQSYRANVVWSDSRDYPDNNYFEVYYKYNLTGTINEPPHVTITSPAEGEEISGIVNIEGNAADFEGSVELVEVKVDDGDWTSAAGTDFWSYEWNTNEVSNGPHKVYARSFDGADYSDEDQKNITVNNVPINDPPIVTIKPLDDVVSGLVVIKGSAYDPDGDIQKVEIKIDERAWKTATGTTSWTYSWDTTKEQDGGHIIYARAKDDDGEYSQIESIVLTIDNKKNIPPIVDITPIGRTVKGTVEIRGTASDPDGDDTLISVQIKVHGDWENAYGLTEWTYNWDTTTLDDGEYSISVRAFDGINYSEIESVSVYVDNPHAPSLTITSELPSKVSGTITIQGTASDIDGEVEIIEIQIDDGKWTAFSESSEWSLDLDTTELSNGRHTIKIRVTDDEGESFIETLTIDVENLESMPWWLLPLFLVIAVVLIVSGVIIAALRRRKGPSGARYVEGSAQSELQNLKCLRCGSVFSADVSGPSIICPNCGMSGSA